MLKRPKRPRDPAQLAKLIGDIAVGNVQEPRPAPDTLTTQARRKGGLKGGKARAKKLTAKRKREIARKAARARWTQERRSKS